MTQSQPISATVRDSVAQDAVAQDAAVQDAAARFLRLDATDNVLVAVTELPAGASIENVVCRQDIPAGHKLAATAIGAGEPVRKFGQIIGFAEGAIRPGEHVHEHNCTYAEFSRAQQVGVDYRPTDFVPEAQRATFQGYVREDGRVATRNMIGVVTTVNCSATVARAIVDRLRHQALKDYPNVDDIVAFTHTGGCATATTGETIETLQRTLGGFMRHPNLAGVLLLGLGCESNQGAALLQHGGFAEGPGLRYMNIQDMGGSRATMERGIEILLEMLPRADAARRQTVSAEHLVLALQCGGSDGYSGITANPALGAAADLVVRHGGTAILSETPEIYGAEQLLTRRAASPAVAEKLLARIRWWEEHVKATGGSMNNNPSHGNKKGGLTTILEKSLGAVAKGGTTGLMDVYKYAEPITRRGFVFMDSPGHDPDSATGQVASGGNIICFTTGRGSVYGCKPAPCLKLTTNTPLYEKMSEDMDIDCGVLLSGKTTVQKLGQQIFARVLEVASGSKSKSEEFGFGDNEFVPWRIGAVM
jgi:altronate hydrolase